MVDLKTQYRSVLSELEYWVDEACVEGEIPKELLGTYFRNGPGMLVNNAKHERHIFGEADGIREYAQADGFIHKSAIQDGRATLTLVPFDWPSLQPPFRCS